MYTGFQYFKTAKFIAQVGIISRCFAEINSIEIGI